MPCFSRVIPGGARTNSACRSQAGYMALQGLRDNSPTPLRVRLYPCNFPHERFSAHDRPTFHGIQHLRFLRCAQS